jgi:hypothetical protein
MNQDSTHLSLLGRISAFSVMAMALSCCGDGARDASKETGADEGPPELEVWTLSTDPALEIGVREGDDPYQFDRATGSALLADGRVVVLDGGSREIRFFDADGVFLVAVGGEGEGPGEFRTPTRLRRTLGDSIQIWDARMARLSFFDLHGDFLGSRQVPPVPEESMPLEEWLLGRNWIDSPIPAADRGPIRRAVLAMPSPDSVGPPRFLKVTRQGRIWAATNFPPADHAQVWTVFDLEGRALARVDLPARFDLHEVGPEYIMGRYRDELDLNFIRIYGLEKPVGSPPGPGLSELRLPQGTEEGGGGEDLDSGISEELRQLMFNAVRATASAQEINYADHYTYTRNLQTLMEGATRRSEFPEGVDVSILAADSRGWIGTFTHRATGHTCGLAYGASRPMGWAAGSLVCPGPGPG